MLLADVGRPTQSAFLSELRALLPGLSLSFSIEGLAICSCPTSEREVAVQLLELPAGPAAQAVTCRLPARSLRRTAASSLVERTCWQ